MFFGTPKNLTWFFFSVTQYTDLVGTTKSDKVKLAISSPKKDAYT